MRKLTMTLRIKISFAADIAKKFNLAKMAASCRSALENNQTHFEIKMI